MRKTISMSRSEVVSTNHLLRGGFTIVELLIVIVVIAILAAISVVAYNGIQNRTNDTVIQNDLSNFGKKLKLLQADTGDLPVGGAIRSGGIDAGDYDTFPGVTYKPSAGSYYTASGNNLYYCSGIETATGQASFRLLAKSKSGSVFEYKSNGSITNLGSSPAMQSTVCLQPYGNAGSWVFGYSAADADWNTWAQ